MESQLTLNNEIFNQAPDKEPYRQYYFMAALNKQLKKPTKKETIIMNQTRRSILAAKDLKKGTIIERDMMVYKRPGYGISPELSYILVGRELKRDLKKDELLKWEDV